jgi:hypothetical protein
MSEIVLDDMPAWIRRRHARLLEAARYCHALRDRVEDRDEMRATDFDERGELFYGRAAAISAEWWTA